MWPDCSALALWAALSLSVQAQIRILTPELLKHHFSATNGIINGGTSVFGAPYYGEHVLGRLRGTLSRGKAHCSDDYELAPLRGAVESQGEKVHDILVLEHDTFCTACKKVRIAQAKGAHAVILVDPSGDPEEQVQQKILGDDGWGQEVRIPSILVSKATGEKVFAAMRQEQVVVELAWDIPQSMVVRVDFWWSSGAKDAQEFLQRFKESAKILGHRMQFVPHYYVFDVSRDTANSMGSLCTDTWKKSYGSFDQETSSVRHCAPDPDGPGPITGADVANEDVRQLCLWHKTAIAPDPARDGLYSDAWWEYVTEIYNRCPWEEPERKNRFGSAACSYKVMWEKFVDANKISRCVEHHADQYLEESVREVAGSEQALRINGWMYRGPLDPETVVKAVCSSFATPMPACEALLNRGLFRSFHMFKFRVMAGTLSWGVFEWMLVAICILSVVNCLLYRRHIVKLVKRQMREEVMIEVQSQMAEYSKLDGTTI